MPDNKDIAVLAKKVYELSVLPAEALEARILRSAISLVP